MKTKNCTCIASLFLLCVLLQACASRKHITPVTPAETQQSTVRHICQAQPVFRSAEVTKMRFSLQYAGRQMAANGSIKFVRDSILVFSLQPVMGIELFRLEVTPDVITLVDKMNRRYAQLSFDEAAEYMGLPVSFADLQAVAMQHVFVIGKAEQWTSCDYTIEKNDGYYTLSFNDRTVNYTFLLDNVNYLLSEAKFSAEKMNASAGVRYFNEQLTDNVLFPQTVEVAFSSPKYQATLTMNMLRRQFNTKLTISPINLKNYAQVDLSVLLP